MKIGYIILAIVLSFAAVIGLGFMSANNYAVSQEASIKGADKDRKTLLANYEIKVVTAAQVPDMYRDDLSKVIRETMQGRYGADGSKAVFQMITEANVTFDSSLYKKIQDLIEDGRNDYAQSQKLLTDKVAQYETGSKQFPRSIFLSSLGYPKINFSDYDPVVTDRVEEAFKTKKESAIKLR